MKKQVSKQTRTLRVPVASLGSLALATGIVATSFFWITSGNGKSLVPVPAYEVSRVIDGDTFVTTENQYIRIASVEAPEIDRCGGKEAKQALEDLILKKPLYLKVLFRDAYDRLVSQVYVGNAYVNETLIRDGYAYYLPRGKAESLTELKRAGEYAREKKLGIFSQTCTQVTNADSPSCAVKGNVRNGNIYYTPECGVYHNTVVQLYLGDRWFCSEKEAIEAGFRKPKQCE